jgi:predicted nucleotidyltransferase
MLRRHRRKLLETARARGARSVRVFGSVARGDADVASDVDLLVELEPGRTLLDLPAFGREAERLLGGRSTWRRPTCSSGGTATRSRRRYGFDSLRLRSERLAAASDGYRASGLRSTHSS